MSITVFLKNFHGNKTGKEFTYSDPTSVFMGRNSECGIVVSEPTVSRFHCLIDIVPPSIKVRDFGSLNGTFVNGTLIGKRSKDQTIEEAQKVSGLLVDLHDGDKLSLGKDCEFQISIKSDMHCSCCGKTVGLLEKDYVLDKNGIVFCASCYKDNARQRQAVRPAVKQETNDMFPGYKTVRLLGHGGMGEVWLAEKRDEGKLYAIKRILPKVAASSKAQESFLREAALANQLFHKNIVTQYSYHKTGSTVFLVQEYCNGGSVEDLMESTKKLLPLKDAVQCIIQTLEGLSYAHSATIEMQLQNGERKTGHGIVHRDFKPSNIFMQKANGFVTYKVADFGLAKSFELAGLSGHTQAGQVAGTPAFMPRQQVLDYKCAKPEVDVWAAAASLYYMLTGVYPKYSNNKDPWLAAVTEPAIPIRKRNNSIPTKLADLIDEALIDNPAIKYKTARSFQTQLLKIYKEILS